MRKHIFAATLIAATTASLPAFAQTSVTVGVGGPAIIAEEDAPTFRRYIVEERVPSYAIPDRVVVGTRLPEGGVVFYDVPERYGPTPNRYTVVNDHPVLVEPRSRRIIRVID